LNGPRAVATIFDFLREANRLLDSGVSPTADARAAWEFTDRVVAVSHRAESRSEIAATAPESTDPPPADQPPIESAYRLGWARDWAHRRVVAKRHRDFPEADRIRQLLITAGSSFGIGEMAAPS